MPWPITRFYIFIYGSFTFNDLNEHDGQPVLFRTPIDLLVHSIASCLIVTKLGGAYVDTTTAVHIVLA